MDDQPLGLISVESVVIHGEHRNLGPISSADLNFLAHQSLLEIRDLVLMNQLGTFGGHIVTQKLGGLGWRRMLVPNLVLVKRVVVLNLGIEEVCCSLEPRVKIVRVLLHRLQIHCFELLLFLLLHQH